jgi:hypothetical protein
MVLPERLLNSIRLSRSLILSGEQRAGPGAWVQTFDAPGMEVTEDPQSGRGLGGFT